jgi:hypothetical protein
VVAAVNGPAVGLGCSVDFAMAAESASFDTADPQGNVARFLGRSSAGRG